MNFGIHKYHSPVFAPKFKIQGANSTTTLQVNQADGTVVLDVDTTNARVGIGTAAPTQRLEVTGGNIFITDTDGKLYLDDGNTYITKGASNLQIQTDGGIKFTGTTFVFNEAGSDVDFRIEGSGAANAFFVQGSDGNVGIGTTEPGFPLHVYAALEDSVGNFERTTTQTTGTRGVFRVVLDSTGTIADTFGPGLTFAIRLADESIENIGSIAANREGSDTDGGLIFQTFNSNSPVDAMVIKKAGNVGIGTTGPTSKLDISGSATGANTVFNVTNTATNEYLGFFQGLAPNMVAGNSLGSTFGKAASDYNRGYFSYNHVGDGSTSNYIDFGFYGAAYLLNIQASGNVGIGVTDPDTKLEIFNAGNQLKLSFDATDNAVFAVDTTGLMTITASGAGVRLPTTSQLQFNDTSTYLVYSGGDLDLYTAANKTLELQTVVYNDIYIPLAGAKVPSSNAPTWAVFDTNLNSYTFALNDYTDLATAEILHDYKEGTDISIHVHFVTNGANDGTARKVKYQVFYSWGDVDETMTSEATDSAEATIVASEADRTHHRLDITTITGTNYKINSAIKIRLKRIGGTGTEPANDPFVEMVGIHYQIDTLGSRTETEK